MLIYAQEKKKTKNKIISRVTGGSGVTATDCNFNVLHGGER